MEAVRLEFRRYFSKTINLYKKRATRPVRIITYPKPYPDEYLDEPKYPPLIPNLHENTVDAEKYKIQLERNALKNLPTVNEKLENLSKEERKVWILPSIPLFYNNLPFYQYVTKTSLIKNLPDYFQDINVDQDYELLKPHLIDTLLLLYHFRNHAHQKSDQSKIVSMELIDNFVRIINIFLSSKYPYLFDSQVDRLVRCDSFWWRGGYSIKDLMIPEVGTPEIGRTPFQFAEKTYLQLRSKFPLPQFIPKEQEINLKDVIPVFNYNPELLGYVAEKRKFTSTPGYWSGDPYTFGKVMFHICGDQYDKAVEILGEQEAQELLIGHGLISSFSWLNSIALFKGFTVFHDVTYPLTCQTVLTTNGKMWSFFAYQLNTTTLSENDNDNKYCNYCWYSEQMQLFDKIENEQIVGLNDDVLKTLIKFMINKPKNININLEPYLKKNTQLIDTVQKITV